MKHHSVINSVRGLLIAFGLLFGLHAVRSQPTFIRTYGLPHDAQAAAVTADSGLVICGSISYSEGYLLRLDRHGNVIWMKRYGALGNAGWGGALYPFDDNHFNGVAVAPDGRIIVVGDAVGVSSFDRSISCFDSLGVLLWGQTSGSVSHNQTLLFAACGSDNSVIVAGANPDLFYEHGVMYKFSTDTTEYLGGVQMFGALSTVPQAIDYAADGNFLMSTGGFGYQLVKLSPTFTPIWQQAWTHFAAIALFGQANGRTIAASDTVIAAINPSGSLAWARKIQVSGGSMNDIAVREDGSILALGTSTNSYSWLLQLDSTGALQWIQRYGNDGDGILLDRLELLSDGSALLVGNALGNNLCVVSVDQNGALADCVFPTISADVAPLTLTPTATVALENIGLENDPGQLDEIDTTESVTDQFACSTGIPVSGGSALASFSITPNPIHDQLQLVFAQPFSSSSLIELIDMQGRLLRSIKGNGSRELTIVRDDMANGLYLIRVMDDQHMIASRKIVVD